MKPVVTASLNQQPFFFEQDAFEQLERYLRASGETLALNPDREEILRDLEQAIADRCQARLRPGATVITQAELTPVLSEMGPVTDSVGGATNRSAEPPLRAPLEQISQGAILSGVCLGIARHFAIDVSLLRIAAVILALFSGGVMIGLYLLLMFLLPYAPVDLDAPPMGRWPRKIRDFVERARARLSTALR